jgi:hypothetical protein
MIPTLQAGQFGRSIASASASSTWNPLDKGSGITLSDGNLTATGDSATLYGVRGTQGHSGSGKYYFEVLVNSVTGGSANLDVGVANATYSLGAGVTFSSGNSWGIANFPALLYGNGSTRLSGVSVSASVIAIAVDFSAGNIFIRYSASGWLPVATSSDPTTGANPAFSTIAGTLYPCVVCKSAGVTARFKAAAFTLGMPSGYSAWG